MKSWTCFLITVIPRESVYEPKQGEVEKKEVRGGEKVGEKEGRGKREKRRERKRERDEEERERKGGRGREKGVKGE